MDDRYLWDKTGPVDADVERLERELGRFRHERRPLRLAGRRTVFPRVILAAAAALLVAAGLAWIALASAPPRWRVESLQGTAVAGAAPVTSARALPVGAGVETDGSSRAKLGMGRFAEISVGPNSRVRLLESRAVQQRLALDRGTLSAKISAPPRLFVIETSSALAVDLGCAYTLSVDDAGIGLLRVETGWVSFERDTRESIVPAGAACATRPGAGPGTPYYEDAAPELRGALESLDFGAGGDEALATVLSCARKRDGLTLWHLLARTGDRNRERVCARLQELVPRPSGVTREAVLRGDARALERWRWELDGMPLLPREGTLGAYWRKLWFRLAQT
jgi:FecR protein